VPSRDEALRRVRDAVGAEAAGDWWDYLLEFGYIPPRGGVSETEMDSAIRAVKYATAIARKVRHRADGSGADSMPGLNARTEAVSLLLAREADGDSEVTALRTRIGALLDWDAIPSWVKRTAQDEGTATMWVEAPVPDGHEVKMSASGFRVTPPLEVEAVDGYRHRLLEYVARDDPTVLRQPVRRGGTLEALSVLADVLARRYGWPPAHATVYLLSGLVPLHLPVRVVTTLTSSSGMVSEVTLRVDPTTASNDVRSAYVRARQGPRSRSVGEKHVRLAAFCAARPGQTGRQKFDTWNALHPEWAYEDPRTFSRDARASTRRLLAIHSVPD
jgi:hypothetical protein